MIPPVVRRVAHWPLTVRALLLAMAYAACWAGAMAWSHRAPTLDSAEQLVWSYSLELGYWKHPPLPSWIMHGLVSLFGPSAALPVFAAQASVAVALALCWRLGCEFMSPLRSISAAALAALIGYHGWGAQDYNHNTALLPFQAAAILAFWWALRGRAWWWWAVAGLFAGLGLMVKYVMLFPLAAIAAYVLIRRDRHGVRTLWGALLAAAVALCVCAPHIVWLTQHDFLPLRYASAVAKHAPDAAAWAGSIAGFLGEQLVQLALFALVLGFAWRRRPASQTCDAPRDSSGDRLYLWIVGFGPLVLLLAYSGLSATELEPRWGSNMFLLAGWAAVDLLGPDEQRQRAVLRGATAALALVLAVVGLVVPAVQSVLPAQGRTQFPGEQLRRLTAAAWSAGTAQPLRLVVSDTWLAGSLAAATGQSIAVFADGEPGHAPWVRPGDIDRCGALVLQDRSIPERLRHASVTRMVDTAVLHGEWVLPWWPTRGFSPRRGAGLHIAWGVLPPRPGAVCRL